MPGRLDAADNAFFGEDAPRVVDRLPGYGANLIAHILRYFVGRTVRLSRHGTQHGQPLGGNLETVFAQETGWTI